MVDPPIVGAHHAPLGASCAPQDVFPAPRLGTPPGVRLITHSTALCDVCEGGAVVGQEP